jgi:uncharacterized protein YkwD
LNLILKLLDYHLMRPHFSTRHTQSLNHSRLALLLLIITSLFSPHQIVTAQAGDAEWLLSQINALRQSKGVPALAYNAQLAAAANAHSTYLSTHPWTSAHVEDNGSTPSSRAWAAGYPGKLVGENVVGGLTADAQWAFNWWMNSPVHFQNMLGSWQEIGIGVVYGETGHWYTLVFGSQAAGVVGQPANDQHNQPAEPTNLPANEPDSEADNGAPSSSTKEPAAQPTRRPTRAPTATPTITVTPTITYTPRATFTATYTITPLPPTSTAIELEVSPQPTIGAVTSPVSVAMITTPGSSISDIHQSSVAPSSPSSNDNGIRRLLPFLFLIQGLVVAGFVGRAVLRRKPR